jgi:small subunit ribosomal protein S20
MPNTKSAERRMRNSERKHLHNRSILSNLRKLERGYRQLLADGKKADAAKALSNVNSAADKAVKSGAVHRTTANRKKSRHAAALNRVK